MDQHVVIIIIIVMEERWAVTLMVNLTNQKVFPSCKTIVAVLGVTEQLVW